MVFRRKAYIVIHPVCTVVRWRRPTFYA